MLKINLLTPLKRDLTANGTAIIVMILVFEYMHFPDMTKERKEDLFGLPYESFFEKNYTVLNMKNKILYLLSFCIFGCTQMPPEEL